MYSNIQIFERKIAKIIQLNMYVCLILHSAFVLILPIGVLMQPIYI